MERHIHKDKNKDKDGKDGKIVFFIFVKCQICFHFIKIAVYFLLWIHPPPAPIGCQGGVGAGHHNNVLGWHDIETFNKVRSTFLGQHSHCIANADGLSPIYSTFISVFSSKTPNWWEGRGGGTGADWGEAKLWPRVGLTDQLMSWRLVYYLIFDYLVKYPCDPCVRQFT